MEQCAQCPVTAKVIVYSADSSHQLSFCGHHHYVRQAEGFFPRNSITMVVKPAIELMDWTESEC